MINKCEFIGNVTAPPEIRFTQSGTPVASFTVACNEKWKDKEGNQHEEVEFVRCVAWQRLAEVCGEYLTTGKQVYVFGKQKTRKWQDKDGADRWTTEIVISEMKMLGSKSDQGRSSGAGHSDFPPEPQGDGETGDDVPF